MDKDKEPIPKDVLGYVNKGAGPCEVNKRTNYLTADTNMLGKLELHPCLYCSSVFARSEKYGWLAIRDEGLRERLNNTIKTARAERVPGWTKEIRSLR